MIPVFFFIFAIGLYLCCVHFSNQVHKPWPAVRTIAWILGLFTVTVTQLTSFVKLAHTSFFWHMVGHLLFGMLAPFLILLARPMTLFLRTLKITTAKRLTSLLKSRLVGVVTHPIVASLLNIGGLWLIYTTPLFPLMHHHSFLHLLIQFHVFLAGYVFSLSFIYLEPTIHRYSFKFRTLVFIFALGGHDILSKYLFFHPPQGVSLKESQAGAILMYYGGDAIDGLLILLFCYQWYHVARPRQLKPRFS